MSVQAEVSELVVALAGNPNSGKTTVFNEMTGSRQHVGNWPGVTVERKEGTASVDGRVVRVVDLPGTYSLAARSQEEKIARDFLTEHKVDVIVNVVDASNLERNLYLTTQLLELGLPVVVALNMVDMAEQMGQQLDLDRFQSLLGAPVVPVVGHRGEGVREVLRAAVDQAGCTSCEAPRSARHNPEIEMELSRLEEIVGVDVVQRVPTRWLLVKALEGDGAALKRLARDPEAPEHILREVENARRHLEQHFGDDLEAIIADGRYGFIGGLLRESLVRPATVGRISVTDRIDNIVLNRVVGIPIFLVLMYLTFRLTFDVGGYFAELLGGSISSLAAFVSSTLPPGPLSSLLSDGVIAGVGGVLVFLPNIAIIFVIISFLEGSGYMARAAFLMDRSMHILGLHGKSFIPMLMGFGCNVPAVMATRTLETREDRILTILVSPFMSCTARLPIYILFAGAFFPNNAALVIFSIYALGVLLGVLSGKLFKSTLFASTVSPFVMELPPYRLPTLKGTVIQVGERVYLFISKAGTVVLAASVIVWAMASLPWGVELGSESSLVGRMGRAAEPIVAPLGLDSRAAVALFFGLGAKEIVVSTIGVLYGSPHHGVGNLQQAIGSAFTPLTAYTFMVFSLIYIPCIATIAAIKRETNSWKWTFFSVAYSLALAYAVAFVVYRIGLIAGVG